MSIGGMGNKWIVTLFKGIGDCSMFLILYWILPKRFAWVSLVIIWFLSLFFVLNTWYFRFWHELIIPEFYRLAGNLNIETAASVKALISVTDVVYILLPVALTALYFICFNYPKDVNKRVLRRRLIMVAVSVSLFLISQFAFAVTQTRWNIQSGVEPQTVTGNLKRNFSDIKDECSIYIFQSRGLCLYFINALNNIYTDLSSSHTFVPTGIESRRLKRFLEEIPEFPHIKEFEKNVGKNVIIILVESLNSDVINRKVNGYEITPFLNTLVNSEGTVSALDIIPQVKDGCSNDGQQLVNTGLLPLSKGVALFTLGDDLIFPRLPEMLKCKSSVAVFGDSGTTWNQYEAYGKYGFKKIFTSLDYKDSVDVKGLDAAMFDFSNAVLDTIHQPFIIEFVTFSMHVPFVNKGVRMEKWLDKADLANNERNYLNITHYTDGEIKKFFANLKKRDLLDSSVVFIVSDHSQGLATTPDKMHGDTDRQDQLPMAFISVNTGITKSITVPAGQVNVFPTILHIMGAGDSGYHGLDRSLLDTSLTTSVSGKGAVRGSGFNSDILRQKRAWQVSDSLLRCNFFSW